MVDEILAALWVARDKLIHDFEAVRLVYGDEVYNMLLENGYQKEHDELLAQIDNRINRRIMQLANEDLSK